VLRLLRPSAATLCLSTLPASIPAAMLQPMAKEEREAVVAHIGTGPGRKKAMAFRSSAAAVSVVGALPDPKAPRRASRRASRQ